MRHRVSGEPRGAQSGAYACKLLIETLCLKKLISRQQQFPATTEIDISR